MPVAERFWIKVARQPSGCWLWQAGTSDGYGRFRVLGRTVYAHRFAYELEVGEIPAGHDLHHTCETPLCVNPAHLLPLPVGEHRRISNAVRPRKTHCLRGHRYEADVRPHCRRCERDRKRRVRAAARAAT